MRRITDRVQIFKHKVEHEVNSIWDGFLNRLGKLGVEFSIYLYFYPNFFFVKVYGEQSGKSIEIGQDY